MIVVVGMIATVTIISMVVAAEIILITEVTTNISDYLLLK